MSNYPENFSDTTSTLNDSPLPNGYSYHLPSDPHSFGKYVAGEPSPALRMGPDYVRPRLGLRLRLFVPTLMIFLFTSGAGILIVTWLFCKKKLMVWSIPLSILVDEGTKIDAVEGVATIGSNLRILTWAAFVSAFIHTTAPIIMLLISYRIAHLWVKNQVHSDTGPADISPTPLQYGMLIEILGSPSILSLGTAIRYLFCGSRAPAPRYFWKAVVLGGGVYLITHLVGVADLWLHTTTTAVRYHEPCDLNVNASFYLNWTMFDDHQKEICHSGSGRWATDNANLSIFGLEVISNYTELGRTVITLQDDEDMSILIPTIEHPHATFESHTIGIQANCSVPPVIGGTPCEASGTMLDCSNVGVRLIPTANDSASLDNAIFSESYYDWAAEAYSGDRTTIQDIPCRRKLSNPVKSLIQLGWEMTPGFEQNMSSNPSISMVPGNVPKYRLFASCDIAVYNVTVKYNGTVEGRKYWGLLNKTLSKPWIADVVLSAHSHNAAAEHIGVNIKSRAMRNGSDDDIEASLGQEVSRLALGMVAGMFDITEAHNVTNYQEIMVGRYKLAPLFTFVLLLMIYGFMALVVFFMAFNMRSGTIVVPHNPQATKSANQKNTRTVSILELVQFRLSSPIPTIVQCFPRANNSVYETGPNHVDAQSVAKKVSTLFSETNPGSTESRVRLEIRETAVRPIFGAWGYEVIVLKNKPSNSF